MVLAFLLVQKQNSLWVSEFNALRKEITIDKWNFGNIVNFMNLFIYKDADFFKKGKLDISTYQKPSNK